MPIFEFQCDLEMREKVDQLLEKIHDKGLDCLSRAERKYLMEASKKFREKLMSHQTNPF